MTASDIVHFVAHWALMGILMFFFMGTVAYLMGLIVVTRRWKIAALILLGFLLLTTVLAALLR